MKSILVLVALGPSLMLNADSKIPTGLPATEALFKSILITGASVSADWNSLSPGKRLGLRHGGKGSVMTIAQGGVRGREMIQRIQPQNLTDRSGVVSVDFLFWDSTELDSRPSIAALERLLEMTGKAGIPLLLGDIPELLPGRQPSRDILNREIRKRCDFSRGCILLAFDQLHRKVVSEGIVIQGRRYSLRELVPDGLHLSDVAGDFLAERILQTVHDARASAERSIDARPIR